MIKVYEVNDPMAIWKTEHKINFDVIHCESCEFERVTEFWFKIDKEVKDLKIIINVEEFIDEISEIDKMLNKKNEWNFLVGYENVNQNQKWKFTFSGILKKTAKPFHSIIDYKIY